MAQKTKPKSQEETLAEILVVLKKLLVVQCARASFETGTTLNPEEV